MAGIYAVKNEPKYTTSEFKPELGAAGVESAYDYKIYELPRIKWNNINCTYIGKPHSCMCGCSGKYSYIKETQIYAGKNRGYDVPANDIHEKSVKFTINKLQKFQTNGIEVIKDYIYSLNIGNKQYTLYLQKENEPLKWDILN
jgi:hypothetical protein